MCGSVRITNKLCSVQRKVAKVITGRLITTVGDIMDIHSYILPIDLLFCKLHFQASLQIFSLSKSHPLYALVWKASWCKAKQHRSPIHNLICFVGINFKEIETINSVRRSPRFAPLFDLIVLPSKEDVLTFANLTNSTVPIWVYSDGSGYEGGVGASTLLYINEYLVCTLRFI